MGQVPGRTPAPHDPRAPAAEIRAVVTPPSNPPRATLARAAATLDVHVDAGRLGLEAPRSPAGASVPR